MSPRPEDDPELRRVIQELQGSVCVEDNSRRIFDLFYPWVRRFFGRLGYRPQDCEDLSQEVLSQVFLQIHSFRQDGSFKSWLFAVASNLHRNEQRSRHREKRNAPEVSLDERRETLTKAMKERRRRAWRSQANSCLGRPAGPFGPPGRVWSAQNQVMRAAGCAPGPGGEGLPPRILTQGGELRLDAV